MMLIDSSIETLRISKAKNSSMTTINLAVDPVIQINNCSSASIKTCTNLARHHLLAAKRFADRIREIEKEHASEPVGLFWDEVLHNALGVVTLAVASLEGYANELYFESSSAFAAGIGLNRSATALIAELAEKERVLLKFELVLAIRTGKQLPHGDPIVQNISALIKLRNAVLHFRPEWSCEQKEHAKLARQLTNRFELSPFLANAPVFPRAWASGSFAFWALQSVKEFLDYFFLEANILNPLDSIDLPLSG